MGEDTKTTQELFKTAMERLRDGRSEVEEVEMVSGRVRMTLDETMPTGIRIEALDAPGGEGVGPAADPERREVMERMKAAAERIRSGASGGEDVPLPGGKSLRMERDESVPGAFTIRSVDGGGGMRSIAFEAAATRPPHYPDDLPFLPDTPVALMEMGEGASRTLTWFNPPEGEKAMDALKEKLLEEGWEEGKGATGSTAHGVTHWVGYSKGEKERVLARTTFGAHATLSLMEKPRKEA